MQEILPNSSEPRCFFSLVPERLNGIQEVCKDLNSSTLQGTLTLMSDLVCIKTFSNRYEAEIAKGFLESEGIEAFVSADDAGGMRPHLAFTGEVRLMVEKESAEAALEILEANKGD